MREIPRLKLALELVESRWKDTRPVGETRQEVEPKHVGVWAYSFHVLRELLVFLEDLLLQWDQVWLRKQVRLVAGFHDGWVR